MVGVVCAVLTLAVAGLWHEPKDEAVLPGFLASAFHAPVLVERHHRLTGDFLFGDPSSLWELGLPRGAGAAALNRAVLRPGRYPDDRDWFAAEVGRAWPNSGSTLAGAEFFRGEIPPGRPRDQRPTECSYYLLAESTRAFLGIFCN